MASCPARNHIHVARLVRRRDSERGTALIEFVLATGLLIVPIFFGLIMVGLSLILANQVTEVCRDTGHMYAYGVDFSQASSQTLVTSQLAQGLGMANTSGKGVIYLSTITYVDGTSCTASGFQANSSSCKNINSYVVIKRIAIGNTSVQASSYAPNITASIIQSSGAIDSSDYLTDTSVRAPAFASLITLTVGQYAYVSQMFINPPAGGLWSLFSSNIVTSLNVF
jgi:Flp pilus assembly protein TadG